MNSCVVLREATPEEQLLWDNLVVRFDNHRIFHKQCWLRSIEAFSGAKPIYLVYEKQGEIVAYWPGFLVKKAFLRIFASPLEGWQTDSMGPVFNKNCITTHELIAALVPFLEKHYRVQHIELASADLDHETMQDEGFRGKMLFTYRIPLSPGNEERTMKNIKAKTRTNLRKAIKLGLQVRFEDNELFVDEAYDQLKEVFRRRGNAMPYGKKRVLECFRQTRAGGNLLAISILLPDGQTNIATGTFMIEGRELILWHWAHRTKYGWYCPIELLTWIAMQKGMEAGCVTFDLTGGGQSKLRFGAVPDETVYRWMLSRYPWLISLRGKAKKAYRWQQALRGRIGRMITLWKEVSHE